jgi:hypothetical protein
MALMEVRRGNGAGFGNNSAPPALLTTLGSQVVTNFFQAMVLDGRGFNVQAGTISAPVVGDVVITDTAAEMAIDAASGTTVMPVAFNVAMNLAAGTLFEVGGRSVATVSSSGTVFVPLKLKSDSSPATSTARVQAAGAVTVTADLVTTTPRHFSWAQPIAAGAYTTTYDWQPLYAPVLVGARCFYVQIAGAGTGPSYFANIDYLEMPTLLITPS